AMYGSGQWTVFDGYAALKWVKAGMRSNNLDPNARLCMSSAVMGFMTQFQSDEPMGCYDDFEAGHEVVVAAHRLVALELRHEAHDRARHAQPRVGIQVVRAHARLDPLERGVAVEHR